MVLWSGNGLIPRVPGEEADREKGACGTGDSDHHYDARVAGVDDGEGDHGGHVEVGALRGPPADGGLVVSEEGVEDDEEDKRQEEGKEGYGGVAPELLVLIAHLSQGQGEVSHSSGPACAATSRR